MATSVWCSVSVRMGPNAIHQTASATAPAAGWDRSATNVSVMEASVHSVPPLMLLPVSLQHAHLACMALAARSVATAATVQNVTPALENASVLPAGGDGAVMSAVLRVHMAQAAFDLASVSTMPHATTSVEPAPAALDGAASTARSPAQLVTMATSAQDYVTATMVPAATQWLGSVPVWLDGWVKTALSPAPRDNGESAVGRTALARMVAAVMQSLGGVSVLLDGLDSAVRKVSCYLLTSISCTCMRITLTSLPLCRVSCWVLRYGLPAALPVSERSRMPPSDWRVQLHSWLDRRQVSTQCVSAVFHREDLWAFRGLIRLKFPFQNVMMVSMGATVHLSVTVNTPQDVTQSLVSAHAIQDTEVTGVRKVIPGFIQIQISCLGFCTWPWLFYSVP